MKPELTVSALCEEASQFARIESSRDHATLFGVTDGKAIGTYVEHQFRAYLAQRYSFAAGSSARGIDFPGLDVDMKVTSIRQPQSSCPFESARQKIFGLGYSLLVFVYEKQDHQAFETGRLTFLHIVFVDKARTADYQTTMGLRQILENDGNEEELTAFMSDRNLPVDEIEARRIAQELFKNPPNIGYLTISNALQWRLQYRRLIEQAGQVEGILEIL